MLIKVKVVPWHILPGGGGVCGVRPLYLLGHDIIRWRGLFPSSSPYIPSELTIHFVRTLPGTNVHEAGSTPDTYWLVKINPNYAGCRTRTTVFIDKCTSHSATAAPCQNNKYYKYFLIFKSSLSSVLTRHF